MQPCTWLPSGPVLSYTGTPDGSGFAHYGAMVHAGGVLRTGTFVRVAVPFFPAPLIGVLAAVCTPGPVMLARGAVAARVCHCAIVPFLSPAQAALQCAADARALGRAPAAVQITYGEHEYVVGAFALHVEARAGCIAIAALPARETPQHLCHGADDGTPFFRTVYGRGTLALYAGSAFAAFFEAAYPAAVAPPPPPPCQQPLALLCAAQDADDDDYNGIGGGAGQAQRGGGGGGGGDGGDGCGDARLADGGSIYDDGDVDDYADSISPLGGHSGAALVCGSSRNSASGGDEPAQLGGDSGVDVDVDDDSIEDLVLPSRAAVCPATPEAPRKRPRQEMMARPRLKLDVVVVARRPTRSAAQTAITRMRSSAPGTRRAPAARSTKAPAPPVVSGRGRTNDDSSYGSSDASSSDDDDDNDAAAADSDAISSSSSSDGDATPPLLLGPMQRLGRHRRRARPAERRRSHARQHRLTDADLAHDLVDFDAESCDSDYEGEESDGDSGAEHTQRGGGGAGHAQRGGGAWRSKRGSLARSIDVCDEPRRYTALEIAEARAFFADVRSGGSVVRALSSTAATALGRQLGVRLEAALRTMGRERAEVRARITQVGTDTLEGRIHYGGLAYPAADDDVCGFCMEQRPCVATRELWGAGAREKATYSVPLGRVCLKRVNALARIGEAARAGLAGGVSRRAISEAYSALDEAFGALAESMSGSFYD